MEQDEEWAGAGLSPEEAYDYWYADLLEECERILRRDVRKGWISKVPVRDGEIDVLAWERQQSFDPSEMYHYGARYLNATFATHGFLLSVYGDEGCHAAMHFLARKYPMNVITLDKAYKWAKAHRVLRDDVVPSPPSAN